MPGHPKIKTCKEKVLSVIADARVRRHSTLDSTLYEIVCGEISNSHAITPLWSSEENAWQYVWCKIVG